MRPAIFGIAALAACATASPSPSSPRAPVHAAAAGAYGPEPATALDALESAAIELAREKLARTGKRPAVSGSLILAARELARRAASGDKRPLERAKVREALALALSFDPAPAAVLAAAPPPEVVAALGEAISPSPATHVGAGVAMRGRSAYLVVLTVSRSLSLRSFPREVEPGSSHPLRGELAGLADPHIFTTDPEGKVGEIKIRSGPGRTFSAEVSFEEPGRYLIEVTGTGPNGPEVAGLLVVASGGAALGEPAGVGPAAPEPADPTQAEAQVIRAIDAARARQGLPPLTPSPRLATVARRHSADMLSRGLLAHVLPGSGGVGERLRSAHLGFRRALENIARAPTALEAHAAAEESPAHRANLLDPAVTEVGCGIARGESPESGRVVYLTEIFVEPVDDSSDSRLLPEGRVLEALWRERERAHRPPLLSDPKLDALALDGAREMLRRGDPKGVDLAKRALALGRGVSAADIFVAASPLAATQSRNLSDPRFRRVGVGVVQGDHPRFGTGLLWIAVVYTD